MYVSGGPKALAYAPGWLIAPEFFITTHQALAHDKESRTHL